MTTQKWQYGYKKPTFWPDFLEIRRDDDEFDPAEFEMFGDFSKAEHETSFNLCFHRILMVQTILELY